MSNEETAPPQLLTEKKKAEEAISAALKNFSLTEGQCVAPPRKSPGTIGKLENIDTNFYQIKTNDRAVYRYCVNVTGESRRGREVDLTKRSESSAVVADRINICRDTFLVIFRTHTEVFGNNQHAVYYDLQSTLYTLTPLDKVVGSTPVQLIVENDDTPETTLPGNLARVTMEIMNVREEAQRVQLDDFAALFNEETLARDRSLLNFIELAVNQVPMFHSDDFLTLRGSMAFFLDGNAHGLPEIELDRGGTKYLASGVQKSATLIEGQKNADSDPKQRKVALLLEAKHSPFHSILPLMEYISRLESTQAMYADFKMGQLNEHKLTRMTRAFKKFRLVVRYPNNQERKIELKSFDLTTANTHQITDLNETVAAYFLRKYGTPLKFPNAHLVCVKQGTQRNFYPPEFLHIADNQVVTAEQMDSKSKAAMIKACAVRPDNLKNQNDRAATAIQLHDSQYTRAAEIQFSKKTLKTESRVLPAPSIDYARSRSLYVDPREAAWRMGDFLLPAQCPIFAVYALANAGDHRPEFSPDELSRFVQKMEQNDRTSGMKFGKCIDSGIYSNLEVEDCVKFAKEQGAVIVFFITPKYIKTCHSTMKMLEHRYNIATQDMTAETAKRILQTAGATWQNYLAKTNMKLGGLNNSIKANNSEVQQTLESVLFIGIASNQPGSKSIVNRVTSSEEEKPGVLGYSGNFGSNYNNFIGDFFYTKAYRPEFYEDLREVFKLCVERFTASRGSAPKNIIFYYGGLTEGQFENAYKYAIPLIKDGIKEGSNGVDIPLTLLAEQALNNVRLFPMKFPSGGKDHEFNVAHGTVVDKTIVHPVFSEFYLFPHSALKGTGRVPRYTVIFDENDYSMDILQGVTHALSYEHQIVSRATKLPTPLYVAENYANRGRDVFNAEFYEHNSELPRNNDNTLNFRTLSEQLNYSKTDLWDKRVNA